MNIIDYFKKLDDNTEETLSQAKSYSAEQLAFKGEGNWTVMQLLEHIVLTEKVCLFILLRPTDKLAATSEIFGQKKLDAFLLNPNGPKFNAPEMLQPKGDIQDVATFEKDFVAERNLLKQKIEAGEIVIDNHTHKHPALGEMTISDWLYFDILHTQRHLAQIKRMLAE